MLLALFVFAAPVETVYQNARAPEGAVLSYDGKYLATIIPGGWAIHDTRSGRLLREHDVGTGETFALMFESDSYQLQVYGKDMPLRLHDALTGEVLATLGGSLTQPKNPAGAKWPPDLRYTPSPVWSSRRSEPISRDLSTGLSGLSIIDMRTGVTIAELPEPSPELRGVTFSADGRSLFSLHQDFRRQYDTHAPMTLWLRRWDLETARPTSTVIVPDKGLTGQAFAVAGQASFLLEQRANERRVSDEEVYYTFPPEARNVSLLDAEKNTLGRSFRTGDRGTAVSGAFVASTAGPKHYTVKVARLENGKPAGASGVFKGAATIHDGVGVSADGTIAVYRVHVEQYSRLVVARQGKPVTSFATPDLGVLRTSMLVDSRNVYVLDYGRKLHRYALDGSSHTLIGESPRMINHGSLGMTWGPNQATLAVAFGDNVIRYYETESGKLRNEWRGHIGTVTNIVFHPSADLAASASLDGTVKLWRPSSGTQLATLMTPNSVDFAAVTPDGYYISSRGSQRLLHNVSGTEIYPFESFELTRHRPEILAERLGFASPARIALLKRAVETRARLAGVKTLDSSLHLPTVEVKNTVPPTTTKRTLALDVSAADSALAIDHIDVSVNGVPAFGSKGKQPGRIEVALSEGVNNIDVSSFNTAGIESLRWRRSIVYSGPAAKKTLHILALGVSDYPGEEYDLTYAAKDAGDIVKTLTGEHPGFDAVHVELLQNGDANSKRIAALKATLDDAAVDDQVVVFVAGHGLLDDKLDYYFASSDVDFAAPAKGGVPYEVIDGLLDGIAPRRKLLLMDTCFSGELDKPDIKTVAAGVKALPGARGVKRVNLAADTMTLMRDLFSDIRRGTGAQVIASAGGGEFAFESAQWRNGVFTYALLEALAQKKADKDQNQRVRVGELYEYVTQRVLTLTGGQQRPTNRRENLSLDFDVIGR